MDFDSIGIPLLLLAWQLGTQALVQQETVDSEEDEAPSFPLRLYRLSHAQLLKNQARQNTWLSIVDDRLLSRPPMSLFRRMAIPAMMVVKLQPQRPETLIVCVTSSKGFS